MRTPPYYLKSSFLFWFSTNWRTPKKAISTHTHLHIFTKWIAYNIIVSNESLQHKCYHVLYTRFVIIMAEIKFSGNKMNNFSKANYLYISLSSASTSVCIVAYFACCLLWLLSLTCATCTVYHDKCETNKVYELLV